MDSTQRGFSSTRPPKICRSFEQDLEITRTAKLLDVEMDRVLTEIGYLLADQAAACRGIGLARR
jgi:hypothetical protein